MSGHYHINADDLSVTFTGEDGTPTRPDLSHLLFTTMHGPSSSGTPVATPPRQDNHPQHLNMGDIPASSQSGTPVAAPTRKENQPQMPNIDNCSGTSMTHIPVAISIRKELPSQMVNKNDLPVQAGPGMPVRTLTRQDPSRQILPTGVLPSLSFGMGASTLSSDTPVTSARVRQGTPHPSLHPDLFNMTELLDQEGSGAPVTAPMRQETAPQKPTKVPSARKVLTPAKPKSAVPKPVKPKAQKPETANSKTQMSEIANPKTLKRRPSSSHPKTPKAKMVKTEAAMPTTVQNCSLNADTTALGQNSTPERIETASDQLSTPHGIANLSLGQLPTARSTLFQQPITRWTLASPTGANLSLSQSSPLGQPFAQQTRAQQAVFHPGSNGIANSPAQSFRAQEPTVQQPAAQQAIVPTIPPAQPNGYPNFADGDVMIISPTGKTWKLHSTILINASSSLKNILAKLDPVHITKKNREDGVTIRWKLVMIEEPDAEKEDPDGLKFKSFKAVVSYPILFMPSVLSFLPILNRHSLAPITIECSLRPLAWFCISLGIPTPPPRKYANIFRLFMQSHRSLRSRCSAISTGWLVNHSSIRSTTTSSSVFITSILLLPAIATTLNIRNTSRMPSY